MSHEKAGIEELRSAVNLFNNCREGFNLSERNAFTAEHLIMLYRAYQISGWDITPDEWTDTQVKQALEGKAPRFEETRQGLHAIGVSDCYCQACRRRRTESECAS